MRLLRFAGLLCMLAACGRCDGGQRERDALAQKLESARESARIEAATALAPKASRDEVLLIARVLTTSTPETREALVGILGSTRGDDATDPLGEVAISDPSDAVRAAAIEALLARTDDKAKAWLPRVYALAGPKGRAAFSTLPASRLKPLVTGASVQRVQALFLRVDQANSVAPDVMLRSAALRELGSFDAPDIVARFERYLADPDPTVAGAAAMGLARTHDATLAPKLEAALAALPPGSPEQGVVFAFALAQLAPDRWTPLRDRLADVDDASLDRVATTLLASKAVFTPPHDAIACTRLVETENLAAVEPLADLLPACVPPTTRPARAAGHAPRLRWATLKGTCHRDLVQLAAEIIYGEPDARRSLEAARYVGKCGELTDAAALLGPAQAEIEAAAGVVAAREQLRALWAENAKKEEAEVQKSMEKLLGPAEASKLEVLPSGVKSKLETLLGGRTRTSELLPLELRPLGHEFVAVALVEGLRLGGDVRPAVESLLGSKTAEVRGLLLAMAPLLATKPARVTPEVAQALQAAFDRLRDDPASSVRRMWVEAMGLSGTLPAEALLSIAKALEPADRPGMASWLLVLPEVHRPAVAALLEAWAADGSVPRAELAPALARSGAASAFVTLSSWVRSVDHSGAEASVKALATLATPDRAASLDALWLGAALHPESSVRVAAIEAMVPGCRGATMLDALSGEADRRVKAAVAAWRAACPREKAP